MEQRELEELTRLITEQVMARLQGGGCPPCEEGKKKLLVIGKTEYVTEEQARGAVLLPMEDYVQNQNILRYDAVLVTKLTLNQLADAALGRTETPECCALVHALLENIPVSMQEKALPHRRYAGKQNAALYHLYEKYLQTLQIYGVKLLSPRVLREEKPATPPKFQKPAAAAPVAHGVKNSERVITEAMAIQLSRAGEVRLRRDAIVTPAAKDVFQAKGVSVLRDE